MTQQYDWEVYCGTTANVEGSGSTSTLAEAMAAADAVLNDWLSSGIRRLSASIDGFEWDDALAVQRGWAPHTFLGDWKWEDGVWYSGL
jgi:hypothetical protein